MKKYLYLTILMAVLIGFQDVMAQSKAKIEFSELVYDFGTFKEADGKVTTEFKFKNAGQLPLIVSNVRASCGCTTPEWTRQPLAPGKSGHVRVTYNPHNRPGAFNKTIRVYSNASNSTVVLKITGKVEPRERTPEEIFPRQIGKIRMKTNHMAFVKVKESEVKVDSMEFINLSGEEVAIGYKRVPAHLTIKAVPSVVKPNQRGYFIVSYDGSKKNSFGFGMDRVYLTFNGEGTYNYSIGVSATIEEDFSKLSAEQLKQAPVVNYDSRVFNFGEIVEGERVEHVFKIKNEGKNDLIIRRIRASCGCTAATPESKVVKGGDETVLKVVFNSRGKRGSQNKSITIITNDPKQPTTILRVTGNVKTTAS